VSDRFYTPTLIRLNNERGDGHVSQIGLDGAAASASAMA
jgi:hypothetical protein